MTQRFHSPTLRSRRLVRNLGALCGLMGIAHGVAGCDIELLDETPSVESQNTCESDLECGSGAGAYCGGGICQTDTTEIPALLLEITPPIGTTTGDYSIGGLRFTDVVEKFEVGSATGGIEIPIGHVSNVVGSVKLPTLTAASCLTTEVPGEERYEPAEDGTVAARLTFTPRARLLGLPAPITAREVVEPGPDGYRANLTITPGQYDVYVEPLGTTSGCVHPPFLVLDQELVPGDIDWQLELPPPELLGVTVRFPIATNDLKGWTLDVIQKDSGRLLSNRAVLDEPEPIEEGAEVIDYRVDLAFSNVEDEDGSDQLVRLSPPEGDVAPTIYLERSVVDLFQDGTGLVDQLTDLSDPVTFSSKVSDSQANDVPATVTLIATSLEATNDGTVAAFSRTVETDDSGDFEVPLLPGEYTVIAEPLNPQFTREVTEVTVSSAAPTQAHRTIVVTNRNRVSSRALSFGGDAVTGASLWADSVANERNSAVLDVAQGTVADTPVAYSEQATDSLGRFELLADVGTYHVSVRPDVSTGFAWGVRLAVPVAGNQTITPFELPLPLVVRGTLVSADLGDAVPNALIRAYALLRDGKPATSAEEADSAIAVAESRADDDGIFTLLLPSTFSDAETNP